jgi:hypothetical protein
VVNQIGPMMPASDTVLIRGRLHTSVSLSMSTDRAMVTVDSTFAIKASLSPLKKHPK